MKGHKYTMRLSIISYLWNFTALFLSILWNFWVFINHEIYHIMIAYILGKEMTISRNTVYISPEEMKPWEAFLIGYAPMMNWVMAPLMWFLIVGDKVMLYFMIIIFAYLTSIPSLEDLVMFYAVKKKKEKRLTSKH